jgi:hypothetical protein
MIFILSIMACVGPGVSADNCRFITVDLPSLKMCLEAKTAAYAHFRGEGKRVVVQCVPSVQQVSR